MPHKTALPKKCVMAQVEVASKIQSLAEAFSHSISPASMRHHTPLSR